jgi:hypothetical protein
MKKKAAKKGQHEDVAAQAKDVVKQIATLAKRRIAAVSKLRDALIEFHELSEFPPRNPEQLAPTVILVTNKFGGEIMIVGDAQTAGALAYSTSLRLGPVSFGDGGPKITRLPSTSKEWETLKKRAEHLAKQTPDKKPKK